MEWHLRRKLAPLLFEDDSPDGARAKRISPVEKAEVSGSAKARSKTTADGFPVRSMTTLLADLATLTLDYVTIPAKQEFRFPLVSRPTPLQRWDFELLDINPEKFVPSTSPA